MARGIAACDGSRVLNIHAKVRITLPTKAPSNNRKGNTPNTPTHETIAKYPLPCSADSALVLANLPSWALSRSPLSDVPKPVPNQKWSRITSIVSCHGDSREDIIPAPVSFPLYTTADVVDEIMFENASGLTIAVKAATIAIIPKPCARSRYLRRIRQSNPQLTVAASKAARAWLENVKYIATAKKNTRRR